MSMRDQFFLLDKLEVEARVVAAATATENLRRNLQRLRVGRAGGRDAAGDINASEAGQRITDGGAALLGLGRSPTRASTGLFDA